MSDPTPQERARDAIYEGIAAQAAQRDPDVLKELAEAYAKVTWGAQGAYSYEADYHHTEHGGEPRPRPEAGFRG
jgi:hypothetical protein